VQLDTDPALVASKMVTDADPTEGLVSPDELPVPSAPDHTEFPEGVPDDGSSELPLDEFVVHADDVFAGRAAVSWRRVYPARRRLTSSCNQDQGCEHRSALPRRAGGMCHIGRPRQLSPLTHASARCKTAGMMR
jgi:hypothetical protein